MKRLAIITTHPIQYNAPFFKLLAERKKIEIKVFYTWSQSKEGIKYDPGFGKNIEWDIPLLDGYNFSFVENIASNPGSDHYNGIQNPTLLSEIKNWGANAVLVYGWSFKSHFAALRHFKKKLPVFFRGDSTLLNETRGIKIIIRRIFLKYIYSYVDTAFYVGISNKNYYKAHGLNENQLVLMPHAIDNKRFERNSKNYIAGEEIRKKYAIEKAATVFLFAGKLDVNKNVGLLINAFVSIKNEGCVLLIVGTGNEDTRLKEMAQNNTNVIFVGFVNQEDMPSLYAASNVFVLPSKGETWGLCINEAMAAGNAIIASDGCGAAADLIQQGRNGFIFKNGNLAYLQNMLSYFIVHKNESLRMGKQSEQIIKKYDYNFDCEALENTLNKISAELL